MSAAVPPDAHDGSDQRRHQNQHRREARQRGLPRGHCGRDVIDPAGAHARRGEHRRRPVAVRPESRSTTKVRGNLKVRYWGRGWDRVEDQDASSDFVNPAGARPRGSEHRNRAVAVRPELSRPGSHIQAKLGLHSELGLRSGLFRVRLRVRARIQRPSLRLRLRRRQTPTSSGCRPPCSQSTLQRKMLCQRRCSLVSRQAPACCSLRALRGTLTSPTATANNQLP